MVSFDLLSRQGGFADATTGAAVVAAARARGVIIRTTYGGFTVNLAPPFVCSRTDLDLLASACAQAISETAGSLS
jgi:adenosylmethionine-8-amino-7-oxononanoate aminotransferase